MNYFYQFSLTYFVYFYLFWRFFSCSSSVRTPLSFVFVSFAIQTRPTVPISSCRAIQIIFIATYLRQSVFHHLHPFHSSVFHPFNKFLLFFSFFELPDADRSAAHSSQPAIRKRCANPLPNAEIPVPERFKDKEIQFPSRLPATDVSHSNGG